VCVSLCVESVCACAFYTVMVKLFAYNSPLVQCGSERLVAAVRWLTCLCIFLLPATYHLKCRLKLSVHYAQPTLVSLFTNQDTVPATLFKVAVFLAAFHSWHFYSATIAPTVIRTL